MDTLDYKSDKCTVAFLSDLGNADAEALVGKTVSHVEAGEYSLVLHFDDGSVLTAQGTTHDEGPLGVEFESNNNAKSLLESSGEKLHVGKSIVTMAVAEHFMDDAIRSGDDRVEGGQAILHTIISATNQLRAVHSNDSKFDAAAILTNANFKVVEPGG